MIIINDITEKFSIGKIVTDKFGSLVKLNIDGKEDLYIKSDTMECPYGFNKNGDNIIKILVSEKFYDIVKKLDNLAVDTVLKLKDKLLIQNSIEELYEPLIKNNFLECIISNEMSVYDKEMNIVDITVDSNYKGKFTAKFLFKIDGIYIKNTMKYFIKLVVIQMRIINKSNLPEGCMIY